MANGNIFNDLANQIKSKTEGEILSIATDSMREFIPASQMSDEKRIFQVLLLAATIGVEGKEQLNAKEKRMVDDFFGAICRDLSIVYEFITKPITEKEWGILQIFPNKGGAAVGLPLLKLILCFAFIDGKLSDDIAEKLEKIFGFVLLGDFLNNGPAETRSFNTTCDESQDDPEKKKEDQKAAEEETKRKVAEEKRLAEEKRKKLPLVREQIRPAQVFLSASEGHSVVLKADGKVVAVGDNSYGQCYAGSWTCIVAVAASSKHTVGLRADGTVVAVGDNSYGQCNVGSWTGIVAVAVSSKHTVGLRADGTVVAVGDNEDGLCNVYDWTDIVAISAGEYRTVGLKADGTVVGVDGWKNIVAISAVTHVLGLKADGTVDAVGNDFSKQCRVEKWEDIVAVSAGLWHSLGLKADGTVVAVGDNTYGQCNVGEWSDIVAVSAGKCHSVGLKSDGTVVAVGSNYRGQCNISGKKLFQSLDALKDIPATLKKKAEEEKRILEEKMAERRAMGLCQYCGGKIKGWFTKKCSNCGTPKDY